MYKFPTYKKVKRESLQITDEGKYSIIDEKVCLQIVNIIQQKLGKGPLTITDANGGVGGASITFARFFNVNCVELNLDHCAIIKHNAKIYDAKINVVCGNYLEQDLKQDVTFFDPPWGGPQYKLKKKLDLYLNYPSGRKCYLHTLFKKALKNSSLVVALIPHNCDTSRINAIKVPLVGSQHYVLVSK